MENTLNSLTLIIQIIPIPLASQASLVSLGHRTRISDKYILRLELGRTRISDKYILGLKLGRGEFELVYRRRS
uniref:Uncharacterized protein n=1 Tax=Cucumis melo TaxID=3656 RepID=A0A9I9E953_CUCME